MKEAVKVLQDLLIKRREQENKIKVKMGISVAYMAIENFNRGIEASINYLKNGNFKGERVHE